MLNQSALGRVLRISRMRKFTRVLVASALTNVVFAQAAVADGTGNPKPTDQAPGTTNWGGLGWGIGIATDFDVGGNRVANASIVNGLVRVATLQVTSASGSCWKLIISSETGNCRS
jgi:hypothetical protein